MSKNIENPTTVETVVAKAAEENLVTPTVPAQGQAEETKKSVDEFDTDNDVEIPVAVDAPKFATIRTGDEVHEFDTVGALLKHITVAAFKTRKVQVATGVVVTAGAAIFAVTRKKATEVIEMDGEDEQLLDDLNEADTNGELDS